uniref:Uncharacterized protein n=1 Tax=Arundo donax TaxID=35708 RepID=A0A0A8Y7D6_ARUDO
MATPASEMMWPRYETEVTPKAHLARLTKSLWRRSSERMARR